MGGWAFCIFIGNSFEKKKEKKNEIKTFFREVLNKIFLKEKINIIFLFLVENRKDKNIFYHKVSDVTIYSPFLIIV